MKVSDEDILILYPEAQGPASQLESYLTQIPGAHREAQGVWILPMGESNLSGKRPTRIERLPDGGVLVSPGATYPGRARARGVVHWLLAHAPMSVVLGGKRIGTYTEPAELYSGPWEDPDAGDPTESPPRYGTLVLVERERGETRESLAIHTSGVVSYDRWLEDEVGDPTPKQLRRMTADALARWSRLLEALTLEDDDPIEGSKQLLEPVRHVVETPEGPTSVIELETAAGGVRRDYVTLVIGWMNALAADQHAMPDGLQAFQR